MSRTKHPYNNPMPQRRRSKNPSPTHNGKNSPKDYSAELKKDGTVYLAQVKYPKGHVNPNGLIRWELIHWGSFAMITPITYGWCGQGNIGLKVESILDYIELEQTLKILYD